MKHCGLLQVSLHILRTISAFPHEMFGDTFLYLIT